MHKYTQLYISIHKYTQVYYTTYIHKYKTYQQISEKRLYQTRMYTYLTNYVKFPECSDDYVGELGRRLYERFSDHGGKTKIHTC